MFSSGRSSTILAGALAFGLVTLASGVSAQTQVSIGFQQEPTTLDPTSDATAAIDGIITHNVMESLTISNESGEVQPALATSWTISDDGLTYTFELARDVTFHDGTEFDAEDVKFSFDRAMAEDSENPTKDIFAADRKRGGGRFALREDDAEEPRCVLPLQHLAR